MKEVKLTELLTLEQLDPGLFRGQSWDLGFRALFGGQVLGQALSAAQQTVAQGQVVHSFHTYFLLPGDAQKPVIYDVENIRDGRSFASRRVKAIQNGNTIFYMTASFQFPEPGLVHQAAQMPEVAEPLQFKSELETYQEIFKDMPPDVQEKLAYHAPLDIRLVQQIDPRHPTELPPVRQVWMRAVEPLNADLAMHQGLLAYASDYYFLATALQPHGLSIMDRNLRRATIDHAMWFHQPFDFNQWLLYSMDSPSAGNARALVRGQFFNQQGELVASTMQEGVIRQKG